MAHTALVMSLVLLAGGHAPSHGEPQRPAAVDVQQHIANLAALDFPVRMQAARLIRRTPDAEAVPALVEAARRDTNEFVRYRALVLLTAFGDPGTPALMRDLMQDRNDRVRKVVYEWFERHPNPELAAPLLRLLQSEQAEFVRPALVAALAALGAQPAVQRALIAETTRGLDFFRSAVIESLGRHRAGYALDEIVGVRRIEGPLQDDAVLAIGRIGGPRGVAALRDVKGATPEAVVMLRASLCLAGEDCAEHLTALAAIAAATDARVGEARAAVEALSAVAQGGHRPAATSLVTLAVRQASVRERAAVALAVVALRRPDWTMGWLDAADDQTRETALTLLKDGFDSLEEDFAEEQFFAAVRANYWRADEGSPMRALAATLIQRLEF